MQNTERHIAALPTGHWLTQERQRLRKTLSDVAKAVHGHSSTVRSVEQNNRVIPPGWYDALRLLGMHIHEPAWPLGERPYCGVDLDRDLRTRVGFQHSRYWLSKQLCIPEREVLEVVRDNLCVPHSWLLKLAELGANVPTSVRTALYEATYGVQSPASTAPRVSDSLHVSAPSPDDSFWVPAAPDPSSVPGEAEPQFPLGSDSPSQQYGDSASEPSADPAQAPSPALPKAAVEDPIAPAARRERSSIYLHWTQDGGLHFSVSAAVLDKIPGALLDLLVLLSSSGVLGPKPGLSGPAARI